MADGTARDERSSEEIRSDIRRTRAEMDDTVDRLEDRLSPGRILDEVWTRVRSRGDGNGVADVLRDHPVPFALMGLGLGWLAIEQVSGRSASPGGHDGRTGPGTWAPAEGRRGPYGPEAVDHDEGEGRVHQAKEKMGEAKEKMGEAKDAVSSAASSAASRAREGMDRTKDRASGAASSARERASGSASSAGSAASRASDRMQSGASAMTQQAQQRARKASRGIQRYMDENPLALGAIAFGLGLASGVSVPTTRTEDRVMGHTADTVKQEGRRMAGEKAQGAARVADEAARAAKDEARRQQDVGDMESTARELTEQVQESARQVAQAAKDAGRDRADEEGLTTEAMKEDVKSAGERTKESAREEKERNT